KRLETQYPNQVDHYAPPVGTLIKQQVTQPTKQLAEEKGGKFSDETSDEIPAQESDPEYDIDTATNATPTLRVADNLILFGPPGTGKTHEMQARMKIAFEKGEVCEFVAFHPSYSYEDFVGGLRPVASADGNGVVVVYQKGPFLRLCEEAHANPTQQFTLFIDEINRANVAKVFGELITLIEPSKRVIAGSRAKDEGAWVTLQGLSYRFGVPDNLNLVATMNTADRSVAMMDIALRRRFRFQECAPEVARVEPAKIGSVDLRALLQCLNDRLEYLLDRDHAIGHAIFIGISSLDELRQVLAQRVIPLLQEYFFEDMEKVRLVLTGSREDSVFITSRTLSPSKLFPGAKQSLGPEVRSTFSVGDLSSWTESDIVGLYSAAPILALGAQTASEDSDPSNILSAE
ncbi:McrB family protein, partial [Achromobacter arsenitoxydans]